MLLSFNIFENFEEVTFQFIQNSLDQLEGLYNSIIDLIYWIPNDPLVLQYLSTIIAGLVTVSAVRWLWSG